MDDIIEDIKKEFREICKADEQLENIREKIGAGTADFKDISVYARRLGEVTRQVIEQNYPGYEPQSEELREFAENIIADILKANYEDVYKKDAAAQIIADAKAGIGLKAIKPEFPKERVKAVIAAVIAAKTAEQALRRIVSPMENITAGFHDDYIRKNAEYRGRAGLLCYIIREDGNKCCDWCRGLAGKYEYPDVPKDIYRRHDNCTCDVSYSTTKGRQSPVKIRRAKEAAKAQRIEYAKSIAKPKKFTKEEAIKLDAKAIAGRYLKSKIQK